MQVLGELEKLSVSKGVPDFVIKLYSILEKKEHSKVISWSDDGEEIQIKNSSKLQDTVLPAYFRHGKLESFIRQLNMYGFSKRNRLTHKNSIFFKNEYFKRGDLKLLEMIKRKKKADSNKDDGETTPSEQRNSDQTNINWMVLADQIYRLKKTHPELQPDMTKIMELTYKITGYKQEDYNIPAPKDMSIPTLPGNQQNFFTTLKSYGQRIAFLDSKCSFGQEVLQDL